MLPEFKFFYKLGDQKLLSPEIYTIIENFKFRHITMFMFMFMLNPWCTKLIRLGS